MIRQGLDIGETTMASSSRRSRKVEIMAPMRTPAALRERLGEEATGALVEMVDLAGREWRNDVLNDAVGRFERRLTEEVGKLRVEMVQMKMDLQQDIAAARVDILRWSFVFWIGQVAAVMGLFAFVLKGH